jgi:hypothetical protein
MYDAFVPARAMEICSQFMSKFSDKITSHCNTPDAHKPKEKEENVTNQTRMEGKLRCERESK